MPHTLISTMALALLVAATSPGQAEPHSDPKPRNVARNQVTSAIGTPIAGARVYIHTSVGTIFDRNQHIWVKTAGKDGTYSPTARFRHEETYAIAPGYYPGIADKDGCIILQRIPEKPLKVREGTMVIRNDGYIRGFNFAKGEQATVEEADIAPTTADFAESEYTIASQGEGGFAHINIDQHKRGIQWRRSRIAMLTAEVPQNPTYSDRMTSEASGPRYVRCRDGKRFAKVHITHASTNAERTEIVISFDYVYQPVIGGTVGAEITIDSFEKMLPGANWHRD